MMAAINSNGRHYMALNRAQWLPMLTLLHTQSLLSLITTNANQYDRSLTVSPSLAHSHHNRRPSPTPPFFAIFEIRHPNRLSMRPIRPMRAPLSLSLSAILQSTHCRHIEAGQWVPRFNCIAHLSPHLLHHNCIITTVRWPSLGRLSTTDHRQIGNITTRLACISPIGSI